MGINGETEAVFNAGGSIKFFNINAARPFGSNETICRQTLVSLLYSTGVNTIYLNTKYKFTAKERDAETGYDYFGARYYDSRIGRWLQVDPLAEKYFGWSPYNYTLNNPIRYFDPNGMWLDENNELNLGDDGKFFAEKPKRKSSSQNVNSGGESRKSSTPTFVLSLSSSLATLFGYNGSIGLAYNPGQSQMYGFIRHGFSAGISASASIGLTVLDQDIESTRGSGSGLKIAPEKNTTEVEGGFSFIGGALVFDSKEKGQELLGFSVQAGRGPGGVIYNETFQSYETKTFNLSIENINKIINPLPKPLLYYK